MTISERDYNISREFSIERPHHLAHIDRLYDPFEGETEPVTITAVDTDSEETVARFHLDERSNATDLLEHTPSPTIAHQGPLNDALERAHDPVDDMELAVVIVPADEALTPVAAPRPAVAHAVVGDKLPDFPNPRGLRIVARDNPEGLSLGDVLDLAEETADEGFAVSAQVKAWTRDDGTVVRLAFLNP